ncbi:hypothetical protein [Frankia sp. Cppng1_Ct_nod]|nr:hypothetical protein [Frankia sp. Cppng1_Ct_nod]
MTDLDGVHRDTEEGEESAKLLISHPRAMQPAIKTTVMTVVQDR